MKTNEQIVKEEGAKLFKNLVTCIYLSTGIDYENQSIFGPKSTPVSTHRELKQKLEDLVTVVEDQLRWQIWNKLPHKEGEPAKLSEAPLSMDRLREMAEDGL